MLPEVERALLARNPWIVRPETRRSALASLLPERWIPRDAEAADWSDRTHAHLVVGPRQAGKSSLLWRLLEREDAPLVLVDCGDPALRGWCRSPAIVLEELARFLPSGGTLFLEEAQHLEEAGLFIKGLVDARTGYRIFVTGSSSYDLGARTRESLAGRATRRRVLPLSLAEVCPARDDQPPAGLAARRAEALGRQAVAGSYPETWTSQDPAAILTHLLDAYVVRDASDLHKIARPDAFRRLLELAAGQIGALVNLSEWASILGVSHGTAASYLMILEESHVAVAVPPFAGGRRRELTSRPKVFFVDNGLRNAVRGGFAPFDERPDRGPLLENWVFTELHKAVRPLGPVRIHHWRSAAKAEVDLVLATAEAVTGWEVKAAELTEPRLSRSSRSFLSTYRPRAFTVVNLAHRGTEHVEGIEVRWARAEDLPEEAERHLAALGEEGAGGG